VGQVQPIPSGFSAATLNFAAGGQQAGLAHPTGGSADHAILLQSGTATDLHPAGFLASLAHQTDGAHQVGTADGHAMLWAGTPGSAVDLNPAANATSEADAVNGNQQGGAASFDGAQVRPMLWTGTAASAVDLTPVGFVGGHVLGIDAGHQVGDAILSDSNPISHAFIWSGTSASGIDLTPAGHLRSLAHGTAFGYILGNFGDSADDVRAMIWTGSTAASALDMHQFLPPGYVGSDITGVDSSGDFYGTGLLEGGGSRAIEWFPVPEPTSFAMLGTAMALLGRKSRREPFYATKLGQNCEGALQPRKISDISDEVTSTSCHLFLPFPTGAHVQYNTSKDLLCYVPVAYPLALLLLALHCSLLARSCALKSLKAL
jgi:hypothetical protein